MIGRQLSLTYKRFAAHLIGVVYLNPMKLGVELHPRADRSDVGMSATVHFVCCTLQLGLNYHRIERVVPGEDRCPNCDSKDLGPVINRREDQGRYIYYKSHKCDACGEVNFTAEDLAWNAEQLEMHEWQLRRERAWARVKGWFRRS